MFVTSLDLSAKRSVVPGVARVASWHIILQSRRSEYPSRVSTLSQVLALLVSAKSDSPESPYAYNTFHSACTSSGVKDSIHPCSACSPATCRLGFWHITILRLRSYPWVKYQGVPGTKDDANFSGKALVNSCCGSELTAIYCASCLGDAL